MLEALGKETVGEETAPGKEKTKNRKKELRGIFWQKVCLSREGWSVQLTAADAGAPVPLWAPRGAAVPGSAVAPLPTQQPLAVHKCSAVLHLN